MSFIEFKPQAHEGVTKVWDVLSASKKDVLGTIRWNGAWRSYCFYPLAECVWSEGCLKDLTLFLHEQTSLHMEKRRIGLGRSR